ncbi:sulfotransferase family protein [Sulfurimonas sediminis]|uniref:Sulfotransferase family protein n=1 Tax=Sulfurimonas sediminis TaxID=2590020 RepID=A0A7M1AYZ9_9BACT|nr:sulfotransferase family 2 domain-containing protein [Sulfurimonas sediminis]QOP42670.1 sulfotransferase family protein [Sulfurimonas sediminis]
MINFYQNYLFKFTGNHALMIYESDSVYTFIPKNACSTMRLSLAIVNGCIQEIKDYNWIHKNNNTFVADLGELIKAKYTFVILRDPFRRVASVYMDKIVDRTTEAWSLYDKLERKIELKEMSFKKFVELISRPGVFRSNIHWRPQIDFLMYQTYDDYFCLEDFAKAVPVIEEKANIKIYDARNLTKHGLDQYETVNDKNFSTALPLELLNLKDEGYAPSYESLYDEELVDLVSKMYKDDLLLYTEKFGKENLLF